LEVHWVTEVVVDGKEHDRFDWAGFAEAKRHFLPAELARSLVTGCEASGFSRPRPNLGKTLVTRRRLRACCAVHSSAGFAVTLPRCSLLAKAQVSHSIEYSSGTGSCASPAPRAIAPDQSAALRLPENTR
jgi:hypothetical protein